MNRRAPTLALDPLATPSAAELTLPLEALRRGLPVGLPSETLYAIAARAEALTPAARGAWAARGAEPRWTWLVRANAQLERLPQRSQLVARLVERYWPGPLTLLVPGAVAGLEAAEENGWTALRRPASGAAQAVLQACDFDVLSADAGVRDAPSLDQRFGAELACVLDSGPTQLGEPAVVLAVGPGRFELVRPGILDLNALRAAAGLRIGFVCTGNTCRSPMAEGLARALLAQRLGVAPARIGEFGFSVSSMGVHAAFGAPASSHSVSVLAERGIDLSEHSSQPATPDLLARLDRVYALTRSHLEALQHVLPPGRARHCALLDPSNRDIADPIGGPRSEYAAVAAQISSALERRAQEWV
ncbi:MAG: Sua5/YciO/YrdC/YwlC family protein [Planctomycetes bacterium]|nr:Sua5/YciO/YrdC/YwlC family protein [Planctomycetota bacterium]